MWHWLSSHAETISKLGPLVAAVSATIAAFGAVYVYRQYRRAQEWRKGDLAAALLSRLESDQELAFACQSLDWGTGPILVPERYRPLMKKFNMPDEAVLDHAPDILASALEPKLNFATLSSAQGLIYRHCFVKLFNHLENISRLVHSKQVAVDDLHGLDYWLRMIASYDYAPGNRNPEEIFQPSLADFGYHTIPLLGRRLGIPNWSVYERHARPSTNAVPAVD